MYYVAFPRSLNSRNAEHGVWDVVKDKRGVKSFDSVEEAIEYAKANAKGEYYVLSIVG